MAAILDSAWTGLLLTLSWPNLLYPVAGTLLAMLIAAVPGLSGVTLLALAIPFTITWEPLPTMLFFGALVGGATFMGSVTAILVNIPGKSSNAAAVLDGYPMSQRGEARTAIGCSAAASALGSTVGILVLVALLPFMREFVLLIGPAEMLMLVLWGLATVSVVTGGSVHRGLAMAGLGLMIGFVGIDPRTAELRYTFGADYLRDGLDVVPVFLGIFAVSEMIDLVVSGRATISGKTIAAGLTGSVREGIRAVSRHVGLFLRSSMIGTIIGLVPGVGGTVAGFIAYGHAVRSSQNAQPMFGQGDIRGVLAPEAANDAKDGGALIPTLAFGVPGGAGTAVLLTVMALHGVTPGLALLDDGLTLVFALIWSLFLSNWLTSVLGVAAVNPLARLTVTPTHYLVPVILSLVAMAAFIYRGQVEDVLVAFAIGGCGYYLKKHGWPRLPFIIALVLGPLFERNLMIYLQLEELGRVSLWSRPIALGLGALAAVSLAVPVVRHVRKRSARQ